MRALPYLLVLAGQATVPLGWWLGGPWCFLTVAVVFVLVPLLDPLLGRGGWRPARPPHGWPPANPYRLLSLATALLQLGLVVWSVRLVALQPLSALELAGLTLSMAVSGGAFGITVAHELIHRATALDRLTGRAVLASVSYLHFAVEHVHGHHRHVATPRDPASARPGESYYRFLPRTLLGSWRSAWQIERARLAKAGRGPWHWRNTALWSLCLPAAGGVAIGLGLGALPAAFFLLQGCGAFCLLEAVNYIEHYGLQRRETAPGQYERVAARHSWDAGERLTNWVLFNLQRHADHHLHAARPWQALELRADSPKLPTGYAGMVLVALLPPLWRRVMDPRLAAAAAS